jgi:hypothetical protein
VRQRAHERKPSSQNTAGRSAPAAAAAAKTSGRVNRPAAERSTVDSGSR